MRWWIMYEPTKLRAAEITIMTWVSLDKDTAAQQRDKAAAVALKAEQARLAAAAKVEAAEIADLIAK